jgi:hypothetical protein
MDLGIKGKDGLGMLIVREGLGCKRQMWISGITFSFSFFLFDHP